MIDHSILKNFVDSNNGICEILVNGGKIIITNNKLNIKYEAILNKCKSSKNYNSIMYMNNYISEIMIVLFIELENKLKSQLKLEYLNCLNSTNTRFISLLINNYYLHKLNSNIKINDYKMFLVQWEINDVIEKKTFAFIINPSVNFLLFSMTNNLINYKLSNMTEEKLQSIKPNQDLVLFGNQSTRLTLVSNKILMHKNIYIDIIVQTYDYVIQIWNEIINSSVFTFNQLVNNTLKSQISNYGIQLITQCFSFFLLDVLLKNTQYQPMKLQNKIIDDKICEIYNLFEKKYKISMQNSILIQKEPTKFLEFLLKNDKLNCFYDDIVMNVYKLNIIIHKQNSSETLIRSEKPSIQIILLQDNNYSMNFMNHINKIILGKYQYLQPILIANKNNEFFKPIDKISSFVINASDYISITKKKFCLLVNMFYVIYNNIETMENNDQKKFLMQFFDKMFQTIVIQYNNE